MTNNGTSENRKIKCEGQHQTFDEGTVGLVQVGQVNESSLNHRNLLQKYNNLVKY
jgi:hypothetical protein